MEMPCLLARKLHRNVSPSSTGLRAQCCSSSVIPAFHGCLLLETSRSVAYSEQIWVHWTSVAEITQLLEGGSSLPIPCHTSGYVQSHVPRALYDFVWLCIVRLSTLPISTIFHSPAALALFGFTIQQKRAHYHHCSWEVGLCNQTTQTTEFGSKVLLFPLRDYCWIFFSWHELGLLKNCS